MFDTRNEILFGNLTLIKSFGPIDLHEHKKIWEEVLGVRIVDESADFFALGGHSLLAIDLIEKIEIAFSVNVSFKDFIENPNLDKLHDLILKKEHRPRDNTSYNLHEFSELSVSQKHLWNLIKLYPNDLTHNISTALRFNFPLNISIFNKVLNHLFEENSILKNHFFKAEGNIFQKSFSEMTPQFELEEIKEEDLYSKLNNEISYHFNLESDFLFRAKIFKISENDFVFFYMVHHIIWDGMSNLIFFQEFMKLYFQYEKNEIPEIKNKPSYYQYIKEQIDFSNSESYKEQLDFWKNSFEVLNTSFLERDKTNHFVDHTSSVKHFKINQEHLDKIESYVKKHNTSLYKIFVSCFSFLLYSKTGKTTQLIGSPIHGRTQRKYRNTLGYFINTLPMIFKLDAEKSFFENLNNCSRSINNTFFNQEIPLDHIIKKTNAGKIIKDNSLFQTLFVYLDVTKEIKVINELNYEILKLERKNTHCEIDLYLYKKDTEIEVVIEYRSSLFSEKFIEQLYSDFIEIVDKVILDDNIAINSLSTKKTAKSNILKIENYCTDKNHNFSFLEKIEQAISENPKKIAVYNDQFALTYEELDRESKKISQLLQQSGFRNGDVVGVYLDRNQHLITTLLSILRSGGTYVPLDANFPQERLNYMIQKANCRFIISEKKLNPKFEKTQVLYVEDSTFLIIDNLKKEIIQKDQSAYVLFTSGSTGNPKGVEVSHLNMTNFLFSMQDQPGLKNTDNFLSVTTISFDISILEIFLPLMSGASLYLCQYKQLLSPEALKNIILDEEISIMQATPVTWRMLLNYDQTHYKNLKVLSGGEALDPLLGEALLNRTKEVWNMYGPTETTVWSSIKKITNHLNITIGKPIASTEFLILDEQFKALAIGDIGELYIGGLGVSKGYIGDSDLTKERFINHPYKENELIYKTGDLAFYNSDGEVLCLGRVDDQVKIRGYRIELSEVEKIIAKDHAIYEIASKVINNEIYVFVSLKSDVLSDFNLDALNLRAANYLPQYMRPKKIIRLDSLPKTLNGKIDKKQLVLTNEVVHKKDEEIRSDLLNPSIIRIVKAIWKKHLNLSKIDQHENFFNLGGHSVVALEIFDEINDFFNLNLDLAQVFEYDSIYLMSKLIQSQIDSLNLETKNLPNIVVINKKEKARNIFCFHGIGGNVLNYYPLSKIAAEYNFYGVQSMGLDGTNSKFYTLKEMAQIYIEQITKIQSKGPYFLAGGSMGGLIAFEVASQFAMMGEKVEKVIMFDTFGPALRAKDDDVVSESYPLRMLKDLKFFNKYFSLRLRSHFYSWQKKSLPQHLRYKMVELRNSYAIKNYKANPAQLDVSLIRVHKERGGVYIDPLLGWGNYISGNLETIEIDGHHESFIESQEFLKTFKNVISIKKIS